MNSQRFAFALERIAPGQWARFERFASQFLVWDYPALRTVATASGDLGRDSELFSPEGDPAVLLQYSVTADWIAKIRVTAKRVRENFDKATILVYVTNQQIGADADELKKEVRRKFHLILDVHDRGWFIDRIAVPPERSSIAEQLARDVADPYLESRDIVESRAPALTEFESKAAVLYLQLQWEDDSREKGLTKLSFEALVKSTLRDTSSTNTVKRQVVRDAVSRLLPTHERGSVDLQVDSALERLDKKSVRHFRKSDEVCLSHSEAQRVNEGLARKELTDKELLSELRATLADYFDGPIPPQDLEALAIRTRRILDSFLLKKGEAFAAAVAQSQSLSSKDEELDILVANDFANELDHTALGHSAVSAVRLTLEEVLQRSKPAVQRFVREISDGYTLFGFLRAVPDVQKAVQKIFRNGQIWLDTSVLLPVMAETLLPAEEHIVSRLLTAAIEAGIELRVTSGVIEEVERHINRCNTYARMSAAQWIGRVPFLYAMFALSGRRVDAFVSWSENFCGNHRPKDDIVDYLSTDWKIRVEDMAELVEATPKALRWEVERIWREAHEARRNTSLVESDEYVIDRLVKHDVECFLGVLGKRTSTFSGELGYGQWWLTFDKTVRDFEKKLREVIGPSAPKAPVMSPDFLADYLAFGPARAAMSKDTEATLPVAMFSMFSDYVPAELLTIAEEVRKECGVIDERLIRRKLRDALDQIKRKPGEMAKGGFAAIRENMERALKSRSAQTSRS